MTGIYNIIGILALACLIGSVAEQSMLGAMLSSIVLMVCYLMGEA